eukprot:TRINITY_DN4336_c0_g1_i1.p1 TRINITY_DN4336_c0_g1~~TRINITY_DN4336_c0_g1_i1.p1  ORF type:complete len:413 (-),score=82.36 TRINITY_DN4336_c0_g1_i1:29-1267(-)
MHDINWCTMIEAFMKQNEDKSWINLLTTTIDSYNHYKPEREMLTVPSTCDKVPESVLDLDAQELARELLFQDMQMIKDIKISEYMKRAWESSDRSPNLSKFIDRFNYIGFWVASEILMGRTPKTRAKIISHFVEVMQLLREMKNYHGMMELYAGLNMFPISRLKYTWRLVPSSSMSILEDISDLTESNYSLYKEELKSIPLEDLPIPYHALILNELSNIEEFATYFPGDIVNWTKMETLASIFSRISGLKNSSLVIEENELISAYMNSAPILTEDELFIASKNVEPERSKSQVKLDLVNPEARNWTLDDVFEEDSLYSSFFQFCKCKKQTERLRIFNLTRDFNRDGRATIEEARDIFRILKESKSSFPKKMLKNTKDKLENYEVLFHEVNIILLEIFETLLVQWKANYFKHI